MTKSTTDLATAVLRDLSVIDATETGDADDVAHIQDVYALKFEYLNDLELVYWSPSEIPGPIFLAVRDLIANEVRGTYGESIPPETRNAREMEILKIIRRHLHKRSSGLPVKALYF